MSYIKNLQDELESEKEHSAFLEKLLATLYGDGWDKLTLYEAERCKVIRPHNKTLQTDTKGHASWCKTGGEYETISIDFNVI